ncbi:MAG TPA: hypothetical protein VM389_13085 [Phycisphaerae bacterium]|nr:hypothetical protein [Phycisphaerae bacterium]
MQNLLDYNPYAGADRLLAGGGLRPLRQPRHKPTLPPLSEEEEKSVYREIGGNLLSGVGYVAGFVDKTFGGRAIRGLLGGKPEEVLSILPGSDVLGITSRANEVTGRDLLEKADILRPNKPGLDWGDVAGFAADVALSPASYVGPGALTKGGRILGMIGKTPKGFRAGMTTTAREVLQGAGPKLTAEAEAAAKGLGTTLEAVADQPARGLIGFGPPLSRASTVVLGFGPKSQKVAGWIDTAASAARWSTPGRKFAQMFSPHAGGKMGKPYQQMSHEWLEGYKQQLADAGEYIAESHAGREATKTLTGARAAAASRLFRNVANGVDPTTDRLFGEIADVAPELMRYAKRDVTKLAEAHVAEDAAGVFSPELGGYFPAGQFPQSPEQAARHLAGKPKTFMGIGPSAKMQSQIAREKWMTRGPHEFSDATLEDMVRDPVIATTKRTAKNQAAAELHILTRWMGWSQAQVKAARAARGQVAEWKKAGKPGDKGVRDMANEYTVALKQARGAAKFYEHSITPWHVEKGLGPRGTDALTAMDWRLQQSARAVSTANATTDALGGLLQAGKVGKAGDAEYVSLEKALIGAGLKSDRTGKYAHTNAVRRAAGRAGLGGTWEGLSPEELAKKALKFAKTHKVPREFADQLAENHRAWTDPAAMKALASAYDQIQLLFKAGVTTAPSFYQRNLNSGIFTAVHIGARDPRYSPLNPMAWVRPWLDARTLSRGGVVKGAADIHGMPELVRAAGGGKLTAAEADAIATRILAGELSGWRTVGPMQGQALEEVPELAGVTAAAVSRRLPGAIPMEDMDVFSLLRRAVPKTKEQLKPWAIAGVGGRTETAFAPVAAGRGLNTYIEYANRIAPYIAKRRQGFSAKAAHELVSAANGDYSALAKTAFERKWMQRIYPFYTFSRKMAEFYAKELLFHPGSPAVVAMQAASRARERDRFVPPHIVQGLALPLGGEKDGVQRFLSNIDFPHEAVFRMFRPGVTSLDTATGTGQEFLGQMNPLIKVPLEIATGTQFFTGRKLEDLDSATGRIAQNVLGLEAPPPVPPLLEELVSGSPLTRGVTMLRGLTDTRKEVGPLKKAVNLLSGVRLTDVDMEKARRIAVREYTKKRLAGQPGIHRYEDVYTTPEEMPLLSPEEILMLRATKTIQRKRR